MSNVFVSALDAVAKMDAKDKIIDELKDLLRDANVKILKQSYAHKEAVKIIGLAKKVNSAMTREDVGKLVHAIADFENEYCRPKPTGVNYES